MQTALMKMIAGMIPKETLDTAMDQAVNSLARLERIEKIAADTQLEIRELRRLVNRLLKQMEDNDNAEKERRYRSAGNSRRT